MKHFGENTLLFAKTSTTGHQEYVSNIRITGNECWGVSLFRIWKNKTDWVLMVHDGKECRATEVKTFHDPIKAMQYAKIKYLDINLPEDCYSVIDKVRVPVEDKNKILCIIGGDKIYDVKREYRIFSEYGGLIPSWKK